MDLTILLYYMGFNALVTSTFSGECPTGKGVLVPAGSWCPTGDCQTICLILASQVPHVFRILCRLCLENKDKAIIMKSLLENFWFYLHNYGLYLSNNMFAFGKIFIALCSLASVFVLNFLNVLQNSCTMLT